MLVIQAVVLGRTAHLESITDDEHDGQNGSQVAVEMFCRSGVNGAVGTRVFLYKIDRIRACRTTAPPESSGYATTRFHSYDPTTLSHRQALLGLCDV